MNQERLDRLFGSIRQAGWRALVLNPGPSLMYLTGLSFHLMERPVLGFFVPGQPVHLVLPELERAKATSREDDLILYPYEETLDSRLKALEDAVGMAGLDGKRVGVEPLRLRFYETQLLQQAAPRATLVPGDNVIESLRLHKDAAEVERMQRAVQVAERALEACLPQIRVGMTEHQLAAELTVQLLRAGSEPELPFSPIVASGPNSALPHAVPTDRPLQQGDMLIVDWGATVDGYISDLTRTFAVGEVKPEFERIYQVVLEANAAGVVRAAPGVPVGSVDAAARQVIEDAGYGPYFIHRTGHGIGMEAHEPPYVRGDNEAPLEPGMAFTIEPGIYLSERGGVRIEDNLVITESGSSVLSSFPRDLQRVG
jgi:Xaa-Pro dipeptidase